MLTCVFFTFREMYTNEEKLILATCSEEANIYIYQEEQWTCSKEAQKFQHPLRIASPYLNAQQIQTLEFHPEGFLTIGTDNGDIIIFDSIKLLFNRHQVRMQEKENKYLLNSIIWSEHTKNCHLSVWNKKGTQFLTGSMDGTAKIWNWDLQNILANENRQAHFTLSYDNFKNQSDTECWAVNWSCSSRYAIATFTKKSKKKSENQKLFSNIQVYDSYLNQLIQKIDSTTGYYHYSMNYRLVSLQLSQYIYIVEVHPFKDNIAFTADYYGEVVIWDITTGRILNIFNEMGTHLLYPNLELPIIDGRFSPSGYSFAISTYYGTFSIYGYGNDDSYLYTPVQQFFQTDFNRFEIDENLNVVDAETKVETYKQKLGVLCQYNQSPYEYQFQQEQKLGDQNLFSDYLHFLKLAKENKKSNKYFQENLNSIHQNNLETIHKQELKFQQLRDFEKCMFMATNFHDSFLSLESLFSNKDDFHIKFLRFQRGITSLLPQSTQYIIKKQFLHPLIKNNSLSLTSLKDSHNISTGSLLSFFNKISMESGNDDYYQQISLKSQSQSKRRGRLSKQQQQLMQLQQGPQQRQENKIVQHYEDDVQIDYDDPEDLNYELSDKSVIKSIENKEEEEEKIESAEISEKHNLRYHKPHLKSNRKILTRSQAAQSKQTCKYSEIMQSNSESYDDEEFINDNHNYNSNRPHRRLRQTFRIVGGSEDSWSDSSGKQNRRNNRYEMRARKKIHFNEEEDEEEQEEEQQVQKKSFRKQTRRQQKLNSSSEENQMELEEFKPSNNKKNDDESFMSSFIHSPKPSLSPSPARPHTLCRLAKKGTGKRNYQQTNTPSHPSRILLRKTLPDYLRQPVIPHRQSTTRQSLNQCSRCNYDNASLKCCISWCGKQFHEHCGGLRGVMANGKFYCHGCFFMQNSSNTVNQMQGQVIRGYKKRNEIVGQSFIDQQKPYFYQPQIGDIVFYLFEAHELFVSRYFWWLDLRLLSQSIFDEDDHTPEILPFLVYQKLEKFGKNMEPLKVIAIQYEFSSYCKQLIFATVTLQLISEPQFKFTVQYANLDSDSPFLILASIYNFYINQILPQIDQFDNATALIWNAEEANFQPEAKSIQIMEIESQDQRFSDSKWQNLLVRLLDSEGYALRHQNQQQFRINCWLLTSYSKKVPLLFQEIQPPQALAWSGDNNEDSNRILSLIQQYIEQNQEECKEFAEPIDLDIYSNYFDLVPIEMPLSKIQTRIRNNYYRRVQALLDDFEQLRQNAELYLTKENIYYEYAEKIVKELKAKINVQDSEDILEDNQMIEEIAEEKIEKEEAKEQEEKEEEKNEDVREEVEEEEKSDLQIIYDQKLPISQRKIVWIINNKSKYCQTQSESAKKKQILPISELQQQPQRSLRFIRNNNQLKSKANKEEEQRAYNERQKNYKLRKRARKMNYAE